MDRNQVLALVREKLADGTIAPSDLAPLAAGKAEHRRSVLPKVLYALGALVVVIGAAILVADNWVALAPAGRILVSLGLAVLAYCFGLVAAERDSRALASAAYAVSVAMAPFGVAVTLEEAGLDPTALAQGVSALCAAIFFAFASWRSRLPVPQLGLAVSTSWAYFALAAHVASDMLAPENLLRAATLVAAAAYAALSWRPRGEESFGAQARALRGFLGFAAVAALLAVAYSFDPDWRLVAGLALAGSLWFSVSADLGAAQKLATLSLFWMTFAHDGAWVILPLALSFLAVYAAVASRSSWSLFLAAATVVAAATRVGGELFAGYLGWAASLIAFGFLLIGAGYATVRLNQKYIKS